MYDQQVIDYIKKTKAAGIADEQIKSALLKNGWTEQEISENFQAAVPVVKPAPVVEPAPEPVATYPSSKNRKPKGLGGLLLALLVLIIIIGLGTAAFIFLKPFNYIAVKKNESVTPPVQSIKPDFAKYQLESTKYTPNMPEYTLKLSDLTNFSDFEKARGIVFSQAQKDALLKNNFFIAKNNGKFYSNNQDDYANRNDDWTSLYGKIGGSYNVWERNPENSVFITSDFTLHVYHKLIDEEFSYIEEANFYPTLSGLSKSLLKSATDAFTKTQDPKQKESYERLSAYFLVPSAILDSAAEDYNKFKTSNFVDDSQNDKKEAVLQIAESLARDNNISDASLNIAKQEIELIFDAKGMASSPLMGKYQPDMFEDYTQFGPRSHYTKNAILRDYFRSMMWYGRMNFLLKSSELTRDAANINLLISSDELKKWESIYLPTSFFVGQSDDLSIYEYGQAIKKTSFTNSDKSDAAISKLQNELITYKNPQIMSSVIIDESVFGTTKEDLQNTTKGFRFMGQRFTPDAFVFSTLTQGNELPDAKTGQSLPSTPTALMVSTLMGSKESSLLLDVWIKTNAPQSDKVIADRMKTLQDYFDTTTQQQWTQNIYWSWLYTIKSLFNNVDTIGYPMFVKNQDWDKKSLQGFLGSWTELKHDTLLYAKQSYAELGAGGPEEQPAKPVPKGYVEPNIKFFDRIIALVNLSKDGLKQFGILPEVFESRNNRFIESLQLYRKIAVSELQNEKISDEDFEKLRLDAGSLDSILYPPDTQVLLEKNARSAIIADVHTDALKQQILYEADGIPNYVYVTVKDANGTRLTKGLVYSYYEFTSPIGKRLTDQDWQKWSYSEKAKIPAMPWWNKDLVK